MAPLWNCFCAYPLFCRDNIIQKMSRWGAQKSSKGWWGDLPQKGGFLNKGRLNLLAMPLQQNYEIKELYFSLFTYIIFQFCLNDS